MKCYETFQSSCVSVTRSFGLLPTSSSWIWQSVTSSWQSHNHPSSLLTLCTRGGFLVKQVFLFTFCRTLHTMHILYVFLVARSQHVCVWCQNLLLLLCVFTHAWKSMQDLVISITSNLEFWQITLLISCNSVCLRFRLDFSPQGVKSTPSVELYLESPPW